MLEYADIDGTKLHYQQPLWRHTTDGGTAGYVGSHQVAFCAVCKIALASAIRVQVLSV